MTRKNTQRQDIYSRVTNKIIADLEQGVRSWAKPWSAEHTSGRITRPLRHNGQAYSGINVLMLWGAAVEHGFSASTWMTFRQAVELGAHALISERTKAGMAAARARGAVLGRPRKLSSQQIDHGRREVKAGRQTISHMARLFSVAPLTLSRALKRCEQAED